MTVNLVRGKKKKPDVLACFYFRMTIFFIVDQCSFFNYPRFSYCVLPLFIVLKKLSFMKQL